MDRHAHPGAGVDSLCAMLVRRDHASLRNALPRIGGLIVRLERSSSPSQAASVRAAFDNLADEIRGTLAKEENLLFPAIAALASAERRRVRAAPLPFGTLRHPIRVMETAHACIEAAIDRLRLAVGRAAESCGRSPAWQRCTIELAAFDVELRDHHFIETEVLFPRALELERRVL